MNDATSEWKLTTLQELTESDSFFLDGDWIESKDQDDKGLNRLIQIADIGDGKFLNKSKRFINDNQFNKINCKTLQYGDILIARMSNPIGRACLFPLQNIRCSTVVDVSILRTPNANPYWLMTMINSPLFRDKIEQYVKGTTRQRVSRLDIASIPFYLPSRKQQDKMSSFLMVLDQMIEAGNQYLKRVQLLRNTVLEAMFSEVKETYMLTDILAQNKYSIRSGPFGSDLLKKDLVPQGIPLLGIDNIQREKFNNKFKRFVKEETFVKLEKYAVFEDDIMITTMGTIGRSCLVPAGLSKALSSKHIWTITLDKNKYLPSLLCWQINYAPWVVKHFEQQKQGGIISAIQSETLKQLIIPVPDMKKQIKIEKIKMQFDKVIVNCLQYTHKINLLKIALTHKLLTGQIKI
jgi:type I restriction enzyme S subunit